MTTDEINATVARFMGRVKDAVNRHRYRQRQQRLKRYGHCKRWDRRYR